MKSCYLIAGALALVPTASLAQSAEDATFGGVKIGASLDYRWHDGEYSLPRIATRIDEDRGGIGYRAHIGYDAQIGSAFVIGGEAGFGRGGKTLRTESLAGDYSIKPRWNWDASGRVGVLPTRSILVYGRAGYSWLRVRENRLSRHCLEGQGKQLDRRRDSLRWWYRNRDILRLFRARGI